MTFLIFRCYQWEPLVLSLSVATQSVHAYVQCLMHGFPETAHGRFQFIKNFYLYTRERFARKVQYSLKLLLHLWDFQGDMFVFLWLMRHQNRLRSYVAISLMVA